MASQWRHKPAILNFETAILNAEPAVKHTQKGLSSSYKRRRKRTEQNKEISQNTPVSRWLPWKLQSS